MLTLLIIAIVLLCIFMLPVRIILSCDDGFCAKVRILFFSFNIPPEKKTKRKMNAKDFKNEVKKLRRSSEKKQKKKKTKKKYSSDDIPFYFNLIKDFIEKTYASAKRGLTVKIQRINIVIATEDAAKTAIMYGVISQGCAYFLEFLKGLTKIKYKKRANINISTDFLSTQTTFDLRIILSWKLYRALGIAVSTAYRALMALLAHNKRRTPNTQNKLKSQKNENTNKTTED